MTILFSILVFLHIVGAAMIVGYWIATIKEPTVHPRQRDGAFLQLLTGIAMMGLLPFMPDADPNYTKLGIKLVIAIVVAVLAIIGVRKARSGQPVSTGLAHGVGGLALLNIAIATIWN
jgi:Na+-translocating ferredoxin:NAD+ oxidoreductase RnfD subunit